MDFARGDGRRRAGGGGRRRGSEAAALALASGCKRAAVSRVLCISRALDEEPARFSLLPFFTPAQNFVDVESVAAG